MDPIDPSSSTSNKNQLRKRNTRLFILSINIIAMGLLAFFMMANPYSGALLSAQTTITLPNGEKAITHFPPTFSPHKRYPVLMALHGMGQTATSAIKAWAPVADQYKLILICPVGSSFRQGFTRYPKDDRKLFSSFMQYLDEKYKVDFSKSVLAGFSRGGNFAIETGILYPSKFRHIICIFGFFNSERSDLQNALDDLSKRKEYNKSAFYFITGTHDSTKASLSKGHHILKQHRIRSHLDVRPELVHSYPTRLVSEFKKIYSFLLE